MQILSLKVSRFFDYTILSIRNFGKLKDLRSLRPYFLKYKWQLLLGIAFVCIANYFAVYSITFVRRGIDYLKAVPAQTPASEVGLTLLTFGGMTVIVALLQGLFMFLMRQTIIVTSRKIEFDQKNDLFRKLETFDMQRLKSYPLGDIMNRMSEDIGRVRMFTGPSIMYIVNTLMTFSFTIGIMFNVNAKLTLFVITPLPILVLAIYFVKNILNHKSQLVQENLAAISSMVQETFAGVRIIKSFGKEKEWINAFQFKTEAYRKANMNLVLTNSLIQPAILLLIGLSSIITIYVGSNEAIQGKVTIGNIAEFLVYVSRLAWPMVSLGWITSLIQRAAASQKRINEFMSFEPTIVSGPIQVSGGFQQIKFNAVNFKYNKDQSWALENISFELKKGQKLGIVGRTGAGKTTLVNLITRQIDPIDGMIEINGQPLSKTELSGWRNLLGCVAQEHFLFSESIAENVSFSNTAAQNQSKVRESMQLAAIEQSIEKFPNKDQTVVGERGVLLSGGQKQRIAIARALFKNPEVFIFDDCLSALDTITEHQILANIKNRYSGKTLVVVSHKISSVADADLILYLENGKIAEKGTHHELMALKNKYFQLNLSQQV